MAPLNVGFVAYGYATRCFHLPFILPNPDLKVYAFLQRGDPPKAGSTPERPHCTVDFPDAKHYQTADDFFGDQDIDLVIVCTQHDTHVQFAEKALLAGKHVVVEKPFTPTSEEADRLIELSKKSGKILTVYQNRRYDSDFRTLYDLYNKGAFGTLTDVDIHHDVDFPDWVTSWQGDAYKPGDGIMFGLGSHSIDQALLLIGQRPTTVTGYYRALRPSGGEVDDTFMIILQFDGKLKDLICTVKTSIVTPMERPLKYLIRGRDGSFLKFGEDPQETQIAQGLKATDKGFGAEDPSIHGKLSTTKEFFPEYQKYDERTKRYIGIIPSFDGSYVEYYKDVVRAIKGEKELFVKPQQSRDGIRVIELARQSAQEGKSVPFN